MKRSVGLTDEDIKRVKYGRWMTADDPFLYNLGNSLYERWSEVAPRNLAERLAFAWFPHQYMKNRQSETL